MPVVHQTLADKQAEPKLVKQMNDHEEMRQAHLLKLETLRKYRCFSVVSRSQTRNDEDARWVPTPKLTMSNEKELVKDPTLPLIMPTRARLIVRGLKEEERIGAEEDANAIEGSSRRPPRDEATKCGLESLSAGDIYDAVQEIQKRNWAKNEGGELLGMNDVGRSPWKSGSGSCPRHRAAGQRAGEHRRGDRPFHCGCCAGTCELCDPTLRAP